MMATDNGRGLTVSSLVVSLHERASMAAKLQEEENIIDVLHRDGKSH